MKEKSWLQRLRGLVCHQQIAKIVIERADSMQKKDVLWFYDFKNPEVKNSKGD
jgi:hypothetical protein